MLLTFPRRVYVYTLFINSVQVVDQRWTQSWDTGSDAVATPALCLSWQKQFPFLATCSLPVLLWAAAVPWSTWKLTISLKHCILKLYRFIYNWMRIFLCINIHTSKCEPKGNWCKTCTFHRICSAAKLGWGQWGKAWMVNSQKNKSPGTFCFKNVPIPIALFWPWEKSLNCGNTVLVKLACVNEEITKNF